MQALSCYDSNRTQLTAVVERQIVRRTKCQLLCGGSAHLVAAGKALAKLINRKDLGELGDTTGSRALDLYNAACLFAVATQVAELPLRDRPQYAQYAWQLLGRALLAYSEPGPWALALADVELEAMSISQRKLFITELKARHPDLTPVGGDIARRLTEEAMNAARVGPMRKTQCWTNRFRRKRRLDFRSFVHSMYIHRL